MPPTAPKTTSTLSKQAVTDEPSLSLSPRKKGCMDIRTARRTAVKAVVLVHKNRVSGGGYVRGPVFGEQVSDREA